MSSPDISICSDKSGKKVVKGSSSDKSIDDDQNVDNMHALKTSPNDSINLQIDLKYQKETGNNQTLEEIDSPFNAKKVKSNQPNFLTKDEMVIKQLHKQYYHSMRTVDTGSKMAEKKGSNAHNLGFPVILGTRQKHKSSRAVVLRDLDAQYEKSNRGIIIPDGKNSATRRNYSINTGKNEEFEPKSFDNKNFEKKSSIIDNTDDTSRVQRMNAELDAVTKGSRRFVDINVPVSNLINDDIRQEISVEKKQNLSNGAKIYKKGSTRTVDTHENVYRRNTILEGVGLSMIRETIKDTENTIKIPNNNEITIESFDNAICITEKDINMKILQELTDQPKKKDHTRLNMHTNNFPTNKIRNKTQDNKRNSVIDLKNSSPNNVNLNLQTKGLDLNKKTVSTEVNILNENKNFKKQDSIISILDDEEKENNAKLMSQNLISYSELQQRIEKIV